MSRLSGSVVALFALTIVCASSVAAAAERDWNPEHTWVFAVGLLEWKHEGIFPSFPEARHHRSDAQLVKFFREQGVPDDRIVYLKDAQATKKHVVAQFNQMLDATDTGDLLILYFAGHDYRDVDTGKTHFAIYDAAKKDSSGWAVDSIFATIDKRFSGDLAMVLADCCHSGALCEQVRRRAGGPIKLAGIASADSHSTSTGAWTFTDALLAGFRGASTVDIDHDGEITFYELGWNAQLDMAFVEGQMCTFAVQDGFGPSFAVAPVVERPAATRVGERVEAYSENAWYKAKVLDSRGQQVRVHYVDYDDSFDEWLPGDRVRTYRPRAFQTGARVKARSEGEWYPATVLKSWYGLHQVHYDDYDAKWDEWVGPADIRVN